MDKSLIKLAYAIGYNNGMKKIAGPRPSERNGQLHFPSRDERPVSMTQRFADTVSLPFTLASDLAGQAFAPGYKGFPNTKAILGRYSEVPSTTAPAAKPTKPAPSPAPATPAAPAPQPGANAQPAQQQPARYDSSQAQALQQQQYGKDILRGMMQFNRNGDPQFQASQGMRDVAQRYKTDSNYAQMLRNAHKSMYGKDDAYTAWYDNWKAQRAAKPAPTPAPQPAPAPAPTPAPTPAASRPAQPAAAPKLTPRVANPQIVTRWPTYGAPRNSVLGRMPFTRWSGSPQKVVDTSGRKYTADEPVVW